MDTTFRGCFSTLAAGVRLVICRLILISALPLDFHGRVRVVRFPLIVYVSFGPLFMKWFGLVVSL